MYERTCDPYRPKRVCWLICIFFFWQHLWILLCHQQIVSMNQGTSGSHSSATSCYNACIYNFLLHAGHWLTSSLESSAELYGSLNVLRLCFPAVRFFTLRASKNLSNVSTNFVVSSTSFLQLCLSAFATDPLRTYRYNNNVARVNTWPVIKL